MGVGVGAQAALPWVSLPRDARQTHQLPSGPGPSPAAPGPPRPTRCPCDCPWLPVHRQQTAQHPGCAAQCPGVQRGTRHVRDAQVLVPHYRHRLARRGRGVNVSQLPSAPAACPHRVAPLPLRHPLAQGSPPPRLHSGHSAGLARYPARWHGRGPRSGAAAAARARCDGSFAK